MNEAYPNYAYYPQVMLKAKHTAKYLSGRLLNFALDTKPTPSSKEVERFIGDHVLGKKDWDWKKSKTKKSRR